MKKTALLFVFLLGASSLSFGQYWYYDYLSQPKAQLGAVALGSKAYFAGGNSGYGPMSKVDIYDVANEAWEDTINLSVARFFPSCVASGDKAYFAGGSNFSTLECYDEVDIWNSFTEEWEIVEHLSIPRFDIGVVTFGNKILFAGGADISLNVCYDIVDIYDTETGTWSTATISQPRSAMGYAVVGDLAIFAGGYDMTTVSNQVDMYNFSTDTWSTATLSQARGWLSAVSVGSKVLIAGGVKADNTPSDRVDIYDASTGIWTTATLSTARAVTQNNVARLCNKAYFVGGGEFDLYTSGWFNSSDVIDIYDDTHENWSVDYLSHSVCNTGVVGIGDHLVVAGGSYFDGTAWWIVSNVDVFVDPDCWPVNVEDLQSPISDFRITSHPNPFTSSTSIEFHLEKPAQVEIEIVNQFGQVVDIIAHPGQKGLNKISWDAGSLPAGIYVCRVNVGGAIGTKKLIVMK